MTPHFLSFHIFLCNVACPLLHQEVGSISLPPWIPAASALLWLIDMVGGSDAMLVLSIAHSCPVSFIFLPLGSQQSRKICICPEAPLWKPWSTVEMWCDERQRGQDVPRCQMGERKALVVGLLAPATSWCHMVQIQTAQLSSSWISCPQNFLNNKIKISFKSLLVSYAVIANKDRFWSIPVGLCSLHNAVLFAQWPLREDKFQIFNDWPHSQNISGVLVIFFSPRQPNVWPWTYHILRLNFLVL